MADAWHGECGLSEIYVLHSLIFRNTSSLREKNESKWNVTNIATNLKSKTIIFLLQDSTKQLLPNKKNLSLNLTINFVFHRNSIKTEQQPPTTKLIVNQIINKTIQCIPKRSLK